MGKKNTNDRCPLQAECEKQCNYQFHELDCDYYNYNSVGEGRSIPDQEERRCELERNDTIPHFWDDEGDDDDIGHDELVYIDTRDLHPHPDNPRKDVGDVTELAESIKANGILQNLTVVPNMVTDEEANLTYQHGYKVIIGHRRLAAAKLAGLDELPCIVVKMSEREQLSTMLTENMQRADLTVYEQAQGFQMMLDLGDTVEDIAAKSGFSTTTVRRRVKMMELDQATLKEVSARQLSLTDFDKLAKVEDIKTRNKLLKDIGTFNFDNSVERALREEYRKKVIPEAKKQVKALDLKEISNTDRYSAKYESIKTLNLDNWLPESGLGIKNADGVFYFLDNWGTLYFYRKRKSTKETKSQEQRDREAAIADIHAAVKEETAIAYDLRSKFIASIAVNQKTTPLLLRGAEIGTVASTILYRQPDRSALLKLYGVDPNGNYNAVRRDGVKAVIDHETRELTPAVVYSLFQDSPNMGYASIYKSDYPKYEENLLLDALYAWLELMGYEMSDDEKALQRSTHRLLHGGEQQWDDCTLCKSAHPHCESCCKNCNDHCNAWQTCRKESEGG